MKPAVLLYRSRLLPLSETFIRAQAGALEAFRPVFVGVESVPGTELPGEVVFVRGKLRQRLFRETGFAPWLLRRLRQLAPALLHAHFAPDAAEALPIARMLRVPMVVTLHGYDVMCSDEAHAATRHGRRYLARREALFATAHRFLCVSEAIRRQALLRGFPEEKLQVLPIGIDGDTSGWIDELTPKPHILFVGRLVEKKSCDVLLCAMQWVQQELPQARLTVVGDGPERLRLQELAGRMTGVAFAGSLAPVGVRQAMRSARCLAVPSRTARNGDAEGLPTVLAEAMSIGLPVVSTRHSGIPELVREGHDGLLAPEGDAETLAEHLLRVCRDDACAGRLRQAARSRVEASFNLRAQTDKLEQCYREVWAEASPSLQRTAAGEAGR